MSLSRTRVQAGRCFFFFNDTATTEIYTLSLHDALPIWPMRTSAIPREPMWRKPDRSRAKRSEEHTSELQSRLHLVCRLLLEKKITQTPPATTTSHSPELTAYSRLRLVH